MSCTPPLLLLNEDEWTIKKGSDYRLASKWAKRERLLPKCQGHVCICLAGSHRRIKSLRSMKYLLVILVRRLLSKQYNEIRRLSSLARSRTHSQHRGFWSHNSFLSLQLTRSDLNRRYGYAIYSRGTDLRYLAADLCPEAALSQPTHRVPARAAQVLSCSIQIYLHSFETVLERKAALARTDAFRSLRRLGRQSGPRSCAQQLDALARLSQLVFQHYSRLVDCMQLLWAGIDLDNQDVKDLWL